MFLVTILSILVFIGSFWFVSRNDEVYNGSSTMCTALFIENDAIPLLQDDDTKEYFILKSNSWDILHPTSRYILSEAQAQEIIQAQENVDKAQKTLDDIVATIYP
jgi:hypothetical protein